MKEGIHPAYDEITITCACGEVINTRSTKPSYKVAGVIGYASVEERHARDLGGSHEPDRKVRATSIRKARERTRQERVGTDADAEMGRE